MISAAVLVGLAVPTGLGVAALAPQAAHATTTECAYGYLGDLSSGKFVRPNATYNGGATGELAEFTADYSSANGWSEYYICFDPDTYDPDVTIDFVGEANYAGYFWLDGYTRESDQTLNNDLFTIKCEDYGVDSEFALDDVSSHGGWLNTQTSFHDFLVPEASSGFDFTFSGTDGHDDICGSY